MHNKKGQKGSSAATLVGIITLIIVFYILFLPPEERADLLGEGPGGGTGTGGNSGGTNTGAGYVFEKETLLSLNVGRIDPYQDVLDKTIPNTYITQTTDAAILTEFSPIYVKNGIFDKKSREVMFSLDETDNVNNIYLSMTAVKRKGVLTIKLNGKNIFEYALTKTNIDPIRLDKRMIEDQNTIEFSVSSVGMKFWTTNEYSLEDLKIIADVTDVSQQRSRNIFTLTEAEYENIEEATLKFVPYCGGLASSGQLMVGINNKNVFSSIPICADPYYIPLSRRMLSAGENYVTFSTTDGSYSIEQVMIEFQSKPTKSIVEYFEMDRILFEGYEEVVSEAKCGEIDGYCPRGCDQDRDKDCCFAESQDNYWCDIETDDADDRCASAIDSAKCSRCLTGYEDHKGDPDEDCEGLCGDDTDDNCPVGCNKLYDKDCCFEENENNYWCDDIPNTGISSVCESALSSGECDDCSFGYRTESGSSVDCDTGLQPVVVEEYEVLKDDYSVTLYIEFVDDGLLKKADINVNGHLANINQNRPYYERDISAWVRADNNYIELYPLTTLNIVNMEAIIE
ncbi:MAG: hypothetical protein V1740_07230 [Candidatus Woesearchaeota archaeon]